MKRAQLAKVRHNPRPTRWMLLHPAILTIIFIGALWYREPAASLRRKLGAKGPKKNAFVYVLSTAGFNHKAVLRNAIVTSQAGTWYDAKVQCKQNGKEINVA